MEKQSDDVPLVPPAVGITYNLKKGLQTNARTPDMEAEYDSMDTVLAIKKAMENHGLTVKLLEADEHLPDKLLEARPSIVFNIAEGRNGRSREAQVPALLSLMGIPFTGSDETTLCIALDKALTKRLLATYHVKTPHYQVVEPGGTVHTSSLRFPVIVKPNAEGSSKGISDVCVAESPDQLRALVRQNGELYGEPVLIEEYMPGREFTVGILGNGKELQVFSPMEIVYGSNTQGNYKVYSYPVKQDYTRYVTYSCPAEIDKGCELAMIKAARRVFEALGCRDFARVDFRLGEDGAPYFIEINPLPGMAPGYSDYPMLTEFCGVSYDTLVMKVLEAGAKRYGIQLPVR